MAWVDQHAYTGEMTCAEAAPYKAQVWQRQKDEAKRLAELTGWKLSDIEQKMELPATAPTEQTGKKWYQRVFGD